MLSPKSVVLCFLFIVSVGFFGWAYPYPRLISAISAFDPIGLTSTVKLEKDFWVPGTVGINTPDRGSMETYLRSYSRGIWVAVVSFPKGKTPHIWRWVEVKGGVVDMGMGAPMTVEIRKSWWIGTLSVHLKD